MALPTEPVTLLNDPTRSYKNELVVATLYYLIL
jgi:hypothetical protein